MFLFWLLFLVEKEEENLGEAEKLVTIVIYY